MRNTKETAEAQRHRERSIEIIIPRFSLCLCVSVVSFSFLLVKGTTYFLGMLPRQIVAVDFTCLPLFTGSWEIFRCKLISGTL